MPSFLRQFGSIITGIAAGFLFGPGAFSAVAFSIGSMVGGFLFNRPPQQEPTKLNDLNMPGNSYGEFIPIVYGGVPTGETEGGIRITGKVIDSLETNAITETREEDRYSWRSTWAVVFADCTDGTPRIIDKLWGYTSQNNLLLYDRNAEDLPSPIPGLPITVRQGFQLSAPDATGYEYGTWYGDDSNTLHIYRGTGTQLPNSALAALHDGVVPAYRWMTYCVLENMAIGNSTGEIWQGQIPALRALIRDDRTGISEIVEAHLERSGIPAGKVDMSAIPADREISGCVQLQKEGSRELCDKLAAIAFCDILEVGDTIVGSDRTNPTEFTVTEEELSAHMGTDELPPTVALSLTSDIDLPSKLNLRFIDPSLDYSINTATALRIVGEQTNERTVEVPAVLTMAQASVFAQMMLDEAWASRIPYKVSLPPGKIKAAPGDVLNVPTEEGTVAIRITKQIMGAPGVIGCEAVSYNNEVYTQPNPATGTGTGGTTVSVYHPPTVVILQSNARSDNDVSAPCVYAALNVGDDSAWSETTIEGSSFLDQILLGFRRFRVPTQATMGIAATALGNHVGGSATWDDTNTIQITMDRNDQALTSCTEDQLLAGTNYAALQTGAGWEYFSFRDVVDDGVISGAQTYTLQGRLWRGRRGTESYIYGHAIGNRFVLLNSAVLKIESLPWLSRAVTLAYSGRFLGFTGSVTCNGINMEPLSPVYIEGTRDGSNNLTITFTGRSRYQNNVLLTGSEPGLAPFDANGYQVSVYTSPGGVLLRNLTTSGGSPQTYSAADQTTDGITPGDPVIAKVWQISALVGLGYEGSATV